MSPVQVTCPGCGAPIELKIGSALVVVCPFCQSLVARGDRAVEDLGKVAAIADSQSPLQMGLTGRYRGKPFELVGRVQYAHAAGGNWIEWYASFPDERWGWLAEAQGRLYMLKRRKLAKDARLKPLEQFELGEHFTIPAQGQFTVHEIGQATITGAEGEIPDLISPHDTHPYIDLTGPAGKFATIDYSDDRPVVYVGREVTLDELGVPLAAAADIEPREVAAVHVACPQCGGSLDLHAPDQTLRVVCPFCDAVLDVDQGNVKYLKAMLAERCEPLIPLGIIGKLYGVEYTVIGFLRRSVMIEGKDYFWQEYLLYAGKLGFRWLVQSDNHWSHVTSVPAGSVRRTARSNAELNGHRFRLFQEADATVVYVSGEFYWKVEVGETVDASDFIRPPEILSREVSSVATPEGKAALELNWSLGTYVEPDVIADAFRVKKMPKPFGVAPNQPFKYGGVYPVWLWSSLAVLIVALVLALLKPSHVVFDRQVVLDPLTSGLSQTVFLEPLEITAHENIRVTVSAPGLRNSWLHVDGDLFHDESGVMQSFAASPEYYSGIEGGESWTEGNRTERAYLSAMPAGKYTLRLEAHRQHPQNGIAFHVTVAQNVFRWSYLLVALGLLAIVPACVAFFRFRFEAQRWENSSIPDSRPVLATVVESKTVDSSKVDSAADEGD